MKKLQKEKKKTTKKKIDVKKVLSIIKDFILKYIYILILILPFVAMDIITRLFGKGIKFYKISSLTPNLFTFTWIVLFVGLVLSYKKKIGKIIYLVIAILFLILFLTNNVYYSMTKTFFDFNLLESASEGSPYILDAIKNCNPWVYVSIVFIVILIVLGYKKIPDNNKNNPVLLLIIFDVFIILHVITPYTLGEPNKSLTWSSWKNPRNVYISFNDNNKSMKISGLYEYSVRNFYVTFLKSKNAYNSEDIEFLDIAFEENTDHKNKYTGLFKDKNLILIQLEGLDNWLLTKNDTPTLYSMQNNAYNFNNHFSYYNGGGSTFNSEFAVNTGFITPLSYTQNAYTFNKNSFPYSMANLFKKLDYTVNAFHMNNGEYYSRTANYKNWGYDNYYGLLDMFSYTDNSYTLDRELILNEKFNELMFPTDKKFVDYIIAYSGHLPFTNTKGVCKLLYDIDHEGEDEDAERQVMSEEECIRRQAKETDYMVELILENLKEKDLIDNTVIVVFTDHYLYTIENKDTLAKYKETSNNLINKTPCFIWSKGMKKNNVSKVTSQLNILPTLLNLFGIEHSTNNYIGSDALDPKYEGIVFFSDYSWYDGNVYVENGEVINKKKISYEKLEAKNYYISSITKKNDLALKYNYFKKKKEDTSK